MRRSELPGERVMEVLDPPHGMGPIQGSLTPLHFTPIPLLCWTCLHTCHSYQEWYTHPRGNDVKAPVSLAKVS